MPFFSMKNCSGYLGFVVILYTPAVRGYTDCTDFTDSHAKTLNYPCFFRVFPPALAG